MDLSAARMQHLRNLASPIHQLPLDILAIILKGFPVWSPSEETTSLLDLLTVGRAWRDAILNLPQLWTAFPLDIPPKLAPLVLERSKNLPLTITCLPMPVWKYLDLEDNEEIQERSQAINDIEEMKLLPGPLEDVLREADRWRTIDFTLSCGLYESVEKLLEAPTPALEVLRVAVKYPAFARTMGPFALSPGSQLKELTLYRVCISWNSPRFDGLITLNLGGTNNGPSIKQFLRILSHSPRLEHLSLESLRPPEYGASSSSPWSSGPIILDCLQTIKVIRSGTKYISALLSSAQFPRSRWVHLWDGFPGGRMSDLDAKIWSVGNEQTAAALGLSMANAERRRLNIVLEVNGINFKNQDSQLQEHFDLIICREDFPTLFPWIEVFLTSWNPIPDVKLVVGIGAPLRSLSAWSPLLRSLHVKGSEHCRRALVELAKPLSPSGLVNGSWMCPGVLEITLEYEAYDQESLSLDIEPLYFLLNQRWSDTESETPSPPQLVSFTWIGAPSGFPEMWRLQNELVGILPSFRMEAL